MYTQIQTPGGRARGRLREEGRGREGGREGAKLVKRYTLENLSEKYMGTLCSSCIFVVNLKLLQW